MPDKESPADRVKREAAEKEQQTKAADGQSAKEQEAEKAKIAANAEAQRQASEAEKERASAVDAEAAAIEAAKKEKFERAEAFEREREERLKARNAALAAQQQSSTEGDINSQFANKDGTSTNPGMDKLHKIMQGLPQSAPDEHILFGLAGIKFTAGDLRDATGMRRG